MVTRLILISLVGVALGAAWLVGGSASRAIFDTDPSTSEVELVPDPPVTDLPAWQDPN